MSVGARLGTWGRDSEERRARLIDDELRLDESVHRSLSSLESSSSSSSILSSSCPRARVHALPRGSAEVTGAVRGGDQVPEKAPLRPHVAVALENFPPRLVTAALALGYAYDGPCCHVGIESILRASPCRGFPPSDATRCLVSLRIGDEWVRTAARGDVDVRCGARGVARSCGIWPLGGVGQLGAGMFREVPVVHLLRRGLLCVWVGVRGRCVAPCAC